MTTLQRIVKWNEARGLLDKGYETQREAAYIFEETLELLGYRGKVKEYSRMLAREYLDKDQIRFVEGDDYSKKLEIHREPNTVEQNLDAFGDIIVFATGAMAKLIAQHDLNLTVDEVINKIMDANDKKGSKVDAAGKVIKSDDFKQPDLVTTQMGTIKE